MGIVKPAEARYRIEVTDLLQMFRREVGIPHRHCQTVMAYDLLQSEDVSSFIMK